MVMGPNNAHRFQPDRLKLEAGKFVTIKLTNPSQSLTSHTFTIDSLNCNTGLVPPGGTATVTFKVPEGTTVFYCIPHKEFPMDGEIIGE